MKSQLARTNKLWFKNCFANKACTAANYVRNLLEAAEKVTKEVIDMLGVVTLRLFDTDYFPALKRARNCESRRNCDINKLHYQTPY